ncbi:MAG: helix-turn-helix transcriptional regulator [Betaproteobacteria bacterium]
MQSLTLVMTDEKVFPSELAAILIGGHKESLVADMMPRKGLPQCEQQILACLLEGHSNKTIANLLNISDATVEDIRHTRDQVWPPTLSSSFLQPSSGSRRSVSAGGGRRSAPGKPPEMDD